MDIKEFKKGVKTQIAKSFNSSEFDCKCFNIDCDKTYIDMNHVAELQKLRDMWGPITINSAFRCAKHNKAVGGSTNSKHAKGIATDIVVRTKTPDQVHAILERVWKGGLGVYNTFVHIDSRPEGRARWDLRKK